MLWWWKYNLRENDIIKVSYSPDINKIYLTDEVSGRIVEIRDEYIVLDVSKLYKSNIIKIQISLISHIEPIK